MYMYGEYIALHSELDFRDESYFSQLTSYKNDNVYKVLSTLEMQYPEVDSHLLAQYFKGLRKNQVIPKISQNVNGT